MPIKTTCNCGFSFNAKDQLAGRKVKCPRCSRALQIPDGAGVASAAKATMAATASQAVPPKSKNVNKALMDLLDEEGVDGIAQGPICSSCGSVMSAASVICVNCGYNTATGEFLETEIDVDTGIEAVGVTDADKLMMQAESEIDENPITAVNQDFGDGADSYVIALGAVAVAGVLMLIGLAIVLVMEFVTDEINPAWISLIVATIVGPICQFYLLIVAFLDSKTEGLLCLFVPFYIFYYGFANRQGFNLIAALLLIFCTIASIGANFYLASTAT